MLAKPGVLAVPAGERSSLGVTHCPWALIVHSKDVFSVTKQYVNFEKKLLVSVLSKASTMSTFDLGNGRAFLFLNFPSIGECQQRSGGGIKTWEGIVAGCLFLGMFSITPTLLNQPTSIECMLWDTEGSRWLFALCELIPGQKA